MVGSRGGSEGDNGWLKNMCAHFIRTSFLSQKKIEIIAQCVYMS